MSVLLAEFAQFNFELLSNIIDSNNIKNGDYAFKSEYAENIAASNIDGSCIFDNEDAYRLSYFSRKQSYPTNILLTATEGHLEDFFGAWVADSEDKNNFDPDKNWDLIFDFL